MQSYVYKHTKKNLVNLMSINMSQGTQLALEEETLDTDLDVDLETLEPIEKPVTMPVNSVYLTNPPKNHILSYGSSSSGWSLFVLFAIFVKLVKTRRMNPVRPPVLPQPVVIVQNRQNRVDVQNPQDRVNYTSVAERYDLALNTNAGQEGPSESVREPGAGLHLTMTSRQRRRFCEMFPHVQRGLHLELPESVSRKVDALRPNDVNVRPNPTTFNIANAERATAASVRETTLANLSRPQLASGLISKIMYERDALPDVGNVPLQLDKDYVHSSAYLKQILVSEHIELVRERAESKRREAERIEVLEGKRVEPNQPEPREVEATASSSRQPVIAEPAAQMNPAEIPQTGFTMTLSLSESRLPGSQPAIFDFTPLGGEVDADCGGRAFVDGESYRLPDANDPNFFPKRAQRRARAASRKRVRAEQAFAQVQADIAGFKPDDIDRLEEGPAPPVD